MPSHRTGVLSGRLTGAMIRTIDEEQHESEGRGNGQSLT